MKHRENNLIYWKPISRWAFLFLGLMCIATGTLSLLRGRTHYPNVWGAPVFAPFTLFVGFLCLLAALRVWERKL